MIVHDNAPAKAKRSHHFTSKRAMMAPANARIPIGLVAELLAGGIASSFYPAHCTDDFPLVVATWCIDRLRFGSGREELPRTEMLMG